MKNSQDNEIMYLLRFFFFLVMYLCIIMLVANFCYYYSREINIICYIFVCVCVFFKIICKENTNRICLVYKVVEEIRIEFKIYKDYKR